MSFVTEELIPDAYRKVNWHIGLSVCLGLFISYSIFYYYYHREQYIKFYSQE